MFSWSAWKLHFPFIAIAGGTFLADAAINPKDLLSSAPEMIGVVLIVLAFLRRMDPLTKAINKNTATTMILCNLITERQIYSEKKITKMEMGKADSDD